MLYFYFKFILKSIYISFALAAFAYIFLFLTGFLGFFILKLLAFAVMIKVLLDINKLCAESPLLSFIIYQLSFMVGLSLITVTFLLRLLANFFGGGFDDLGFLSPIAFLLLALSFVAMCIYYKTLKDISNEAIFWIVLLLNAAAIFIIIAQGLDEKTILILQGLGIVAFFVELYAWSKVEEFVTYDDEDE